ncbi:MAG: MiaB/RimO family radical SAM methylthiotransferase [Chloroflexi bacterium]|nr:MiaB/RimO family radical SAM methylthiotransferase [Chloroflexota bacterium]
MRQLLPVLDVSPGTVGAPAAPAPRVAPALDVGVVEFATEDTVLPRFHVWTLGCQMNRSDSEEMAGALLSSGCSEAAGMDDADLIVINSCAIRETAEQKIIGRMGVLGRLKAANPALRVVLTGCSVRADENVDLRRRYPQIDLFLRPDEEPELTARLGLAGLTTPGGLGGTPGGPGSARFARVGRGTAATADRLPGTRAAAVATGSVARGSDISAWLPIIYGCDKTCTYCIVPFSRGPERSRPFDQILDEARSLADAGYQEVTLLGQNVNSYGHDLPPEERFKGVGEQRRLGRDLDLRGRPDMAALLRAIDGLRTADGLPAIPRLRFVTSHPWDLTDRLIAAIAECPSVCEHLHLPVQSGDDGVLRRMGRQYTAEAYLSLVERLRSAIPGISLSTDVICGFSGESERAFENTLALLQRVGFDQVFAAAFSVRPGTPAARLVDDVTPAEKRARLNRLLDLQERISRDRNAAWLGRTTEVLVDGVRPERAHGHDGGIENAGERLTGRNREHRLVHLAGLPELVGRRVPVIIERTGPYALAGRLLA